MFVDDVVENTVPYPLPMHRPTIVKGRRMPGGRFVVAVCLAGCTFLVGACSGATEGADRNAAVASAVPSASASLVQWTLDVNWCFTNKGAQPVQIYFGNSVLPRPESYSIQGGPSGEGGPVSLTNAMTVCSSGGYSVGEDRHAEITFANGRRTDYAAYNPSIGMPSFFYEWQGTFTKGYDDFAEGDVRTYDRHYNRVRVERLPDTGTKEFRITFEGEIPPA